MGVSLSLPKNCLVASLCALHCTSGWRAPQLLHTGENEGSWTILSWYWGKKLKIWSSQAKNWASECIYGDLINNLGCEHFVSGCMLRHFSVPPTVSHNHRKVLLYWQDSKQTLLETPFIQTTSAWEPESWAGLTSFTLQQSTNQVPNLKLLLCSKWWESGTSGAGFIPPAWNTCLKRARSESPLQMGTYRSIWCVYTPSADRQKYTVLLLSLNGICSQPHNIKSCHWSGEGWAQPNTKSSLKGF